MCLARVYRREVDEEGKLLSDVALLRPQGEKLFLRTLFGEEKTVKAKIVEIDFANSTVLVEED